MVRYSRYQITHTMNADSTYTLSAWHYTATGPVLVMQHTALGYAMTFQTLTAKLDTHDTCQRITERCKAVRSSASSIAKCLQN